MRISSSAFAAMIEGNEAIVTQRATFHAPIVRENLCPDPSFESGNLKWWSATGGASIISETGNAYSGSKHGTITFPGSPRDTTRVLIPISTRPGSTYVASAYINPRGGMQFGLDTSSATPVSVVGSASTTVSGSYQRVTTAFTASAYTTLLRFRATNNPIDSDSAWVDAILVEELLTFAVPPAPAAGDYFDGNSLDASWFGTPNLSQSTAPVDVYPDATVSLVSCEIQREVTTDVPDGTRLITGYPTAKATLALAGPVDPTDASKDAAWLFSPYSQGSPLYRYDLTLSKFTVERGLYTAKSSAAPELFDAFVGYLDDYTINPQTGEVRLECLDPRSKLRSLPSLPAIGAAMEVASGNPVALVATAPGLTAAWVIDVLLRANGIYSSPGPRPGASLAFYASFVGSAHPSVYNRAGYPPVVTNSGLRNDEASTTAPMQYTLGRFNHAVCRDAWVVSPLAVNLSIVDSGSSSLFAEWWMSTSLLSISLDDAVAMTLDLTATDGNYGTLYDVSVGFVPVAPNTWRITGPYGTTALFGSSGTWQQFSLKLTPRRDPTTHVPTMNVVLYLDGVQVAAFDDVGSAVGTAYAADTMALRSMYPIEAFQLTSESLPIPTSTFEPTADLDPSLNTLVATVDITGQDPWQVIQDLAEAESAVAGFDESGSFRFINRDTIREQAPSRVVHSEKSLKSYSVDTGLSSVANRIIAPVNAIARSAFQAVWVSGDSLYDVLARSTLKLDVATAQPVIGVSTRCGVIPTGGPTPVNPLSGYRAAKRADGSGGEVTNLKMKVEQTGPSAIHIEVVNPNNYTVYLVTPTSGYPAGSVGKPSLVVGGEFVESQGAEPDTGTVASSGTTVDLQWPAIEDGGAASSPYGEVAKQLSTNLWRQDVVATRATVSDLLGDLARPRPLLIDIGIVLDPRLQLLDRVTLRDPTGESLDEDVVIVGITSTSNRGDWSQKITARVVGTPGGWILGVPGRSELGRTTYA